MNPAWAYCTTLLQPICGADPTARFTCDGWTKFKEYNQNGYCPFNKETQYTKPDRNFCDNTLKSLTTLQIYHIDAGGTDAAANVRAALEKSRVQSAATDELLRPYKLSTSHFNHFARAVAYNCKTDIGHICAPGSCALYNNNQAQAEIFAGIFARIFAACAP